VPGVRTASDTVCRITIAKLAATFVVTATGAELRAIESGKQSEATHVTRDRAERILCGSRSRAGGPNPVPRPFLSAPGTRTPVCVELLLEFQPGGIR
jgi:hypothetical protein